MKTVKVANAVKALFTLALAAGFLVSSCMGASLLDVADLPDVQEVRAVYEFDNPESFVKGMHYETAAGDWHVEDGRLKFSSRPNPGNNGDAKLKFLETANMINSVIQMDIAIQGTYSGNDGNGGILLHMGSMADGGDLVDGYYVGAGKKGNNSNFHFESAWFGLTSGWHDLNNNEGTNIPYTDEYVHLVVTIIDGKANIKVFDKRGRLMRELDGNTSDGRGAPPSYGFAGIRVWQCDGWIDNVKITNIGPGLDIPGDVQFPLPDYTEPTGEGIALNYDFANAASFVKGVDYETRDGTWAVKGGRLEFDSEKDGDAKLKFLKSPGMANSTIEMDIMITDYHSNGGGNVGPVLRMGKIEEGGDKLEGYYVGTGKKDGGSENFHWESAVFDMGWHGLNDERTEINSNDGYVHLEITVIDEHATITVKDRYGNVKVDKFGGDTFNEGGVVHSPKTGFAGIRAWNCAGYIDNVRITNVGPGLDF